MLGDSAGGYRDGGDTVGGGGGSNSGDGGKSEEGVDRNFGGGNRWPRQETLALLKIRSDMDVTFRDASLKAPLWDEVSRKMADLGYQRNSKKCKEKFENVYKYHKRTKEGKGGKSDGKTYRFFDQLQALENNPSIPFLLPPPLLNTTPPSTTSTTTTVPSTTTITSLQIPTSLPQFQGIVTTDATVTPQLFSSADLFSNSSSFSSFSDETMTMEEGANRRKKRKWKDFFEKLMKEVVVKQEELHKRFLEAIEKRERERLVREETWRLQEMQRITREREILAHERSISAAKDDAVMAFLQKISQQRQDQQIHVPSTLNKQPQVPHETTPTPTQTSQHVQTPTSVVQQQTTPVISQVLQLTTPVISQALQLTTPVISQVLQLTTPQQQQQGQNQQEQVVNMDIVKSDNNGESVMQASSSRWPKTEVEALIKLRTTLDKKYQENVPKGPLWEEISGLMKKLGYNRNAKRCKEKWENINKYFKKAKESNKKRPEDSKTCPYFHQLDALYREKNKGEGVAAPRLEGTMMAPLMVRPEQQWPPQQHLPPTITGADDVAVEDAENDRPHPNEEEYYDEDGEDEEDEDEGSDNYEVVANKQPPPQ